jgi:tetratricopeptide (TPR) repeat protein
MRGLELLEAGDNDGAIDYLKKAVEQDESNSMYRTWLGRAYIAKLQTSSFMEKGILSGRALEQLRKAVDLDPANVEARVTLAGYYLNAPSIAGGSKKKAREQAEEIVKYDEVRGNWLLARVLIKEERFEEAIEMINACISADPGNADFRYQLAMVYQQLERWNECFVELEAVLAIEPDAAGAIYQIGRTAALSGENTDRGIECLERYLTLEVLPGYPGHDGAHWRLGIIYEMRGDSEMAKEHFETAIRLNPDEERYRKSLNELASQ